MNSINFNPIIEAVDDQLIIPEVGPWAEKKYSLVGNYCNMFTRSMRNKWDNLVYIDLYSGSGLSKIKETGKILYASPLIALSLPIPFTHYIFCEENLEKIQALKNRVKTNFPTIKPSFIEGNCDNQIYEIVSSIPKYSKSNTVLCFCFVDPFSLDLKFETIKQLGSYRSIDFLILFASYMDANRNFHNYFSQNNDKIATFLGMPDWRIRYKTNLVNSNQRFIEFIFKLYTEQMLELGYQKPTDFAEVRDEARNLGLYHLAFYSKNNLGNKIWNEATKYATDQTKLDL